MNWVGNRFRSIFRRLGARIGVDEIIMSMQTS